MEPVVPGAPPWEPPPAFTAAAAGMPAWPAPVSDPHAMPPWPAATGELEAEPDEPGLLPPFDPNATNPEGFARPAHYFDPDAAKRDAEQDATNPAVRAPEGATPPDGVPALPGDPGPGHGTAPDDARSAATHSAAAHSDDAHSVAGHDELGPDDTRLALPFPTAPGAHPPPLAAPVAMEEHAGDQAPHFDPGAPGHDATAANPSIRPPEPGDVPVWPPTPPTGDKLPELPFSRDTWGQRPSTSLDVPRPPAGGPAFPPGAFKQPRSRPRPHPRLRPRASGPCW
ncbi:hypothetical protein ACFQ0B_04975 [Nonomuraea thailandensis]